MTVADLITELEGLGVRLWEESGQLHFRAPQGVLTEERKLALRQTKAEVLEYLRADGDGVALRPEPELRHEPFPLNDLQSAYLLGRRETFAYGGVGSHIYAEISVPGVTPEALDAAWRTLVHRHGMLRAVVDPAGTQRVQAQVTVAPIPVDDQRGAEPHAVEAAVAKVRAELEHRTYQPDQWPQYELRMTRDDRRVLLHLSIDFLVADFSSIQRLLLELNQLCYEPTRPLAPIDISYRDYLVAARRFRDTARYERDRGYWAQRLDALPGAPELPLVESAHRAPARFHRHQVRLPASTWAALRDRVGRHQVTASVAVLAAFAEVVGRWSRTPRFTLNLTLFNRQPFHPQVGLLVGDFTSLSLLSVDAGPTAPFAERVAATQTQLWADLDHRGFSGVEVLRELARQRGAAEALLPVVFTSTIGLNEVATGARQRAGQGEFVYGVTQTPQVWLDCQVTERADQLEINWDVRDGIFPDGLVEDMVAAYAALLTDLAAGDDAWTTVSPVPLPAPQLRRRLAANDTGAPIPDVLLHEGVVAQALRTPDRPAVATSTRTLTFGELLGRATAVADRLRADGLAPNDLVAIVMDKGWEQVVAVLGVLLAGGTYLPLDTHHPPARRAGLLADAGARHVLTQSWVPHDDSAIVVDRLFPAPLPAALPDRVVAPEAVAYVLFTSGSTGAPKGTMISHRSAVNTVTDINRRFEVGPGDRVLGLAHLGFDLSVYDLFGPMAAGGCLVLPDAARRADPSHWAALIDRHQVTLLNTVPAQLAMLQSYLRTTPALTLASLRLAFMSGDRIPVALPDHVRDRLPHLRLMSLGGPTETTIWSIHYPIGEVGADWRSIPYGRPLTNHAYHVLDPWLRDRPDWVPGEIYTSGAGLALGYLNDPERTAEYFLTHPETGLRLYRSGDIGCYLPDGDIEILGRQDAVVKVRGHRIALAEVEAALLAAPDVAAACAVVDDSDPVDARLGAFVVARPADARDAGVAAPAAIASAVGAVADPLAGGEYERFVVLGGALDEAGLATMLDTLHGAGLFAVPGAVHSAEDIIAALGAQPRYHRIVRRWLRSLVAEGRLAVDVSLEAAGYRLARPFDPGAAGRAWARVRDLGAGLPSEDALIGYFQTCARLLPELLRGEADPVQLLYPQGTVETAVAVFGDNFVSSTANHMLAAALAAAARTVDGDRPVRILEAGAGHWGAAAHLLPALDGSTVDYLFTDVAEFFVNNARAAYGGRDWVRYGTFDMNRDHRSQGLRSNSFDIVVAANVMHYARDAGEVLARLRELLTPGGWLVFTDTVRDNYLVLTSVEFLFQFDDERPDFTDARHGELRSFLDAEDWTRALREAGADPVLALPAGGHVLSRLGARMFAGRFKADRARLRPRALRDEVATRLPEYMVPSSIEVVDALPVTDNAKIDRDRLRGWLPPRGGDGVAAAAGEAPRDELERGVSEVWADVLGVPEVGRDQNFFELGGDSLLAARLVGDIGERLAAARDLPFEDLLAQMLQAPTVADFAGYLRDNASTGDGSGRLHPAPLVGSVGGSLDREIWVHGLTGVLPAGATDGLVVDDVDGWLAVEPSALVERLAGRYAQVLVAAGATGVRLAGQDLGGLLAVETARQLLESGVDVVSVRVDGSWRPPYADLDEAQVQACFAAYHGAVDDDRTALMYRFFRHALAGAAAYEPAPYLGDLTVATDPDRPPAPWQPPDPAAFWQDLCLGEVIVA